MNSPYDGLDQRSHWQAGVAERAPGQFEAIYVKKFDIGHDERIAVAGSGFAHHIATQLRGHGFHVIDTEPSPPHLPQDVAQSFGFKSYSARYGEIATVRQMLQLVQECEGARTPFDIDWEKEGRHFDALRPTVEPEG